MRQFPALRIKQIQGDRLAQEKAPPALPFFHHNEQIQTTLSLLQEVRLRQS
jgi:hypothetical protein